MLIVLIVSLLCPCIWSLDNGLALTPPLGWLTWERFRCQTNCKDYPKNCIGETLIKEMADVMVSDGYKDAGYEYIIIDDCWPASKRTSEGRLQGDPERFPNGMKALADYIHSKGLKFGIYEDFGKKTCAGYPGSEFYMKMDSQTFADWGVDFVKFDQCNADPHDMKYGYPVMEFFMNKTGRPMVFACEWPLNNLVKKIKPDFAAIRKTCNMWRNYNDIEDSFDSVLSIINYWAKDPYNMSSYAGPGGWNDPDEIIVGDFGLSHDQERVQMGMWCMFAAPLLLSNDLRNIRNSSKALILNKRLLAINQDPLGIQAKAFNLGYVQVWTRSILPLGSKAVAVLFVTDHYPGKGGNYIKVTYPLSMYGITDGKQYDITEVFDGHSMGTHNTSSILTFNVNPTGIFMFTVKPL
ncbi:alpha-N-acetylgalactosaminidase-like [Mytilus edulis]|uniref:alpha-N-acetylgalactosaminidase-like n=1 Tax=Mytilus edulis TaxID=6550 RepID=UPI0039EF8867